MVGFSGRKGCRSHQKLVYRDKLSPRKPPRSYTANRWWQV